MQIAVSFPIDLLITMAGLAHAMAGKVRGCNRRGYLLVQNKTGHQLYRQNHSNAAPNSQH